MIAASDIAYPPPHPATSPAWCSQAYRYYLSLPGMEKEEFLFPGKETVAGRLKKADLCYFGRMF